jgi:hypothetical protein
MAKNGVPPDPGGYLEDPTILGSALGMKPHWHSYSGQDLDGSAAVDKFNQYASSPIPGGSDGKDPLSKKDKKGR